MKLEIVAHCWQYSRLLTYQLSSLCLYPVLADTTMTVFYCLEDQATVDVLAFFSRQYPTKIQWNFRALQKDFLFRRAIGRNIAALETTADWIWFCDCDQVFQQGCLDALEAELEDVTGPLAYPRTVRVCPQLPPADSLIMAADTPQIVRLETSQFSPVTHNRAVGALQITRGEIARRKGYCRANRNFMRPAETWQRTFEDVRFREILGTPGEPIDIPELYRIEHQAKGRDGHGVSL